jgi:hypothetical protein
LPGVAEHVSTLDDDLAAAVRRLADEELRFQLDGLAGPRRELLADMAELLHQKHAPDLLTSFSSGN